MQLKHDPIRSIKNKIQLELNKLETKLTMQQYYGSNPDIFYGTAKFHKLLRISQIVSNSNYTILAICFDGQVPTSTQLDHLL